MSQKLLMVQRIQLLDSAYLKFLILLGIFFLIFVMSCSKEQKGIPYYQILSIDKKIPPGKAGINFIDSMLEIYPKSEYLYGMKIMKLAGLGYYDSAYSLYIHTVDDQKINGTFMVSAFGYYYMFTQSKNGYDEYMKKIFIDAINRDPHKINIYARTGLYNICYHLKEYGQAEKYLYEAYEINNEDPYILHNLANFYKNMNQTKRALHFLEKIDPKYKADEIQKLGITIDSLLQADTLKK